MLKVFKALVKRDMTLAWRRRTDLLNAVLFFVMVSSLFPLAIGADPKLLRLIELSSDHYNHKTFGKTYVPVLKLVDWVREPDADEPAAAPAVASAASPASPPPPPSKALEPEKPKRTRF